MTRRNLLRDMRQHIAGVLVLLALYLALMIAATSHSYPDGWYWDLPRGHFCGVEIAPTPGLFCDVT